MTYRLAATAARRSGILLALSMATGLAGCGSLDDMLFGSDTSQPQPVAANQSDSGNPSPAPGTLPGDQGAEAASQQPGAPAEEAPATSSGITPIAIATGPDTGTPVGRTVQTLRAQLSGIQDKVMADAQQMAELRSQAAQETMQYHDSKSTIQARLQLGTTRANPELIQHWNTAQSALDGMTGNINQMNAIGSELTNEDSAAHFTLNSIEAAFNLAGGIDEDHQQLTALRDETNQLVITIDSLISSASDAVQRQTTFVANERSSLTVLASAIKDGTYYGDLGPQMVSAANYRGMPASGPALVTIKFDHPKVEYQQILYTAVAQALQSRPGSGFSVVAVSPTKGTAASVQLAQSDAERHARDVVRSLTDMGVPATRLDMSSSTDPRVVNSEVRVYVR